MTPSPEAVPGAGIGPAVQVGWEISRWEDFRVVERGETTLATAATDHTVHVDPFHLNPATTYFYRFTILDGPLAGQVSPVGRTLTHPSDDTNPGQWRLAVCSCANYEAGYFQAYADIARRAHAGEIDVAVHMGDYLYEYASGEYAGKDGVVRPHVPTWELTALPDYRSRYGHYRLDPDLQAAHAALPWVVTWDDHEIANNAWAGGASEHTGAHGDWAARRDHAMQAYLEWLPVRGTSPSRGGHIYRTLRYGTLAELHMLDLRSYRSAPGLHNPLSRGEDRTIMGSEQFRWLSARLATASTRWNLIGTSVMMAPLDLINIAQEVKTQLLSMIGVDLAGTTINVDQWDGYQADRQRLLDQLARTHAHGRTVFLTGDIHSEWANHIWAGDRVVAAELVCSSVTAANVDDLLRLPVDSATSLVAETHVRAHNPHIAHVDLDAHGYSTLLIHHDAVEMSWQRVSDVTVAGSGVSTAHTMLYDGAQLTV
ncbi:Phospholipase D precursor [Corynebacterium atrinae]|nr:Phospholipase D precursor [Corynebacterium atrinae]